MGTAARYPLPTPSCIPASEFDLDPSRFRHFVDRIESIRRIPRRVIRLVAEFPVRAARRSRYRRAGARHSPYGPKSIRLEASREVSPCAKHRLDSSRTYSRYAFISIAPSIPHSGPCPGTMTSGSSQMMRSRLLQPLRRRCRSSPWACTGGRPRRRRTPPLPWVRG